MIGSSASCCACPVRFLQANLHVRSTRGAKQKCALVPHRNTDKLSLVFFINQENFKDTRGNLSLILPGLMQIHTQIS